MIVSLKLDTFRQSKLINWTTQDQLLILLELNVIRTSAGILLHLEVVCRKSKGIKTHVAELLQVVEHFRLHLLVPLLDFSWKPPDCFVSLYVTRVDIQD